MSAQNLKTVRESDFFAVKFDAHACYYTLSPQCKVRWFYKVENDGGNSLLCNVGYLPRPEYTIVSLRTVVFKHSRLHDYIKSHGR